MTLHALGGLLFGLRQRVTRGAYATAGFALMALKYGVDFALSAGFAERPLTPITYLNPVLSMRLSSLGHYPLWLPVVMALWALPFVWVGVTMTARRALDAGKSPWLGLLFFVPVVNYLLMLGLCVAPQGGAAAQTTTLPLAEENTLRAALIAVACAMIFGLFAVLVSVFGARQYGSSLFVAAPFVVGVISGSLLNRKQRHSVQKTLAVALLSVTLCGGLLLIFALEGALCLLMAAVLAFPLACLGGLVGRAFADGMRPGQATSVMVVSWPLLALLGWDQPSQYPVRAVVSSVEIAAPPERVWPNIIGFAELPPPSEWLLKTGVACPLRAHIAGEGVGAVRYCEFSTGPFVEPITAWEPPFRLAFDVTQQPPSMREWSPYEIVHAPHVEGGMQSVRGEFRVTALPNGHSRLTGTTWYRLKMSPNAYWALLADQVVHVIHIRVLKHVRNLSEGGQG